MAGIVVPMEGVAVGFEPVPDGDYTGKFTAYKNGTANVEGQTVPKIDFEFTIDEPAAYVGKKVFISQTVILNGPKANLHYLKELWVKLGADPDDLQTNLNTDAVNNELRGSEVSMKVGHRDWQGRVYNTVRIVDPNAASEWGAEENDT